MNKGYYLHFERYDNTGVRKKIDSHITHLSKYYLMKEVRIENKRLSLFKKILARFPFTSYGYDFHNNCEIEDPSFIYIRQTIFDKSLRSFLKDVKVKYPKCKILLEVVTYPYKFDFFKRFAMWPLYFKDKFNLKLSSKYIDRIITFSKHTEISGIKTINTINGINLDTVSVINSDKKNEDLNLISVAVMRPHHGYERIINGLSNYFRDGGKENVIYHVVGNGFNGVPEFYENLVKKLGLKDKVIFHGKLTGPQLDEIYNISDIGICSLGSYKIKVDASSQLKSREYLAKGLPMITACYVDVLNDNNFPYYLEFENNNLPIDIQRVLGFYEEKIKYNNRKELTNKIRQFAEEYISLNEAFSPIIKFLDEV